jgi:hypothetical protein
VTGPDAAIVPLKADYRPVVICGFGELGQTVANMLESPLAATLDQAPVGYIAFDLQPARIDVSHPPYSPSLWALGSSFLCAPCSKGCRGCSWCSHPFAPCGSKKQTKKKTAAAGFGNVAACSRALPASEASAACACDGARVSAWPQAGVFVRDRKQDTRLALPARLPAAPGSTSCTATGAVRR